MTKREFAARMAAYAGGSAREAVRWADAFTASMKDALAEDETVYLRGFGEFSAVLAPAKKGLNPRTGQRIDIPPRVKLRFKEYDALKQRLNP